MAYIRGLTVSYIHDWNTPRCWQDLHNVGYWWWPGDHGSCPKWPLPEDGGEQWRDDLRGLHVLSGGKTTFGILTQFVLNSFQETWGYICIFLTFFNTEMVQVIEILPSGRQGSVYPVWSTPWLLMTWLRKEPGHQQPWCWLSFTPEGLQWSYVKIQGLLLLAWINFNPNMDK